MMEKTHFEVKVPTSKTRDKEVVETIVEIWVKLELVYMIIYWLTDCV